jgi:hypothetical protein
MNNKKNRILKIMDYLSLAATGSSRPFEEHKDDEAGEVIDDSAFLNRINESK